MESKAGFSTSGSDEFAAIYVLRSTLRWKVIQRAMVWSWMMWKKTWGMCIDLCCKAMFAYLPALDWPMIFHIFGHNIPRWTYCDDGRGGVGNLSLSFEKVWRPTNLHLPNKKWFLSTCFRWLTMIQSDIRRSRFGLDHDLRSYGIPRPKKLVAEAVLCCLSGRWVRRPRWKNRTSMDRRHRKRLPIFQMFEVGSEAVVPTCRELGNHGRWQR